MEEKKKGLPKVTLVKIFTAHYTLPYKYKYKDTSTWERGYVDTNTIINFDFNENVLLLKPLYTLTAKYIQRIHELMCAENDEFSEELDLSEQGIKEFREHLQDTIKVTPYIIVDYLRREGFHVPMYGIDLFRAGIAHPFLPHEFKNAKSRQ